MAKSDWLKLTSEVTRAFREHRNLILVFGHILGIEHVTGNEYYLVTPTNKAAGLRFFDNGNTLRFVVD